MEKTMYSIPLVAEKKKLLKEEIEKLDIKPKLQVIQVGDNSASNSYIKAKRKACYGVGIEFNLLKLKESITNEELIEYINEFNYNKLISGILVQLPLPDHIDANLILNSILPEKDVDGLTLLNVGKLNTGLDGLFPCTAVGIINLLKYYNIELEGKNVVIIGRSNLVGKPTAALFQRENATVTICHSKTNNLKSYTSQADILVVAIGKKEYITKEYIKEDAIIVDVGITKESNKLYGDANFQDIYEKCKMITPVPKGVGPMTVITLLENILKAYKNNI